MYHFHWFSDHWKYWCLTIETTPDPDPSPELHNASTALYLVQIVTPIQAFDILRLQVPDVCSELDKKLFIDR